MKRNAGTSAFSGAGAYHTGLVLGRARGLPGQGSRRDPGGRPGPREVEAPDTTVHVEDLAHEVKPRAAARRHGAWLDLRQRHATCGYLRVVVASAPLDGERPVQHATDEPPAVLASELSQPGIARDAQMAGDRGRDRGRKPRAERALHQSLGVCRGLGEKRAFDLPERPTREQAQRNPRLPALLSRSMPEARNVQHDRPAHPEVRPQKGTAADHTPLAFDTNDQLGLVRHAGEAAVEV